MSIAGYVPKVELHAHLSGCIRSSTFHELTDHIHVKEHLIVPPQKAYSVASWDAHVDNTFAQIATLTRSKDVLRRVTLEVIEDFAMEGTVYLELRIGLKASPTKRDYLETLLSAVAEGQQRHPTCVVKLVLSVARNTDVTYAREQVELAIEHFRSTQPDPVVVGIEMGGSPFCGSWQHFRCLFDEARAAGLKVSLHCGENTESQAEWEEMIRWRPDRLGHGTFLNQANDHLLISSMIPVEFCLSVAERFFCQTKENMIFRRLSGHPIVFCSDNTTLNDTTLTAEYEKAMSYFGLSFGDLVEISWRAIDHAFASSPSKEKARSLFRSQLALALSKASHTTRSLQDERFSSYLLLPKL